MGGWIGSDGERERGWERRERLGVRKSFSDGEREREREMRDHGERELIFTHKILISLLQLSYSVIPHLESHYSTISIFFAMVKLYKFCLNGSFGPK